MLKVSHWGVIGKDRLGLVIVLKFLIRLEHSSLPNEISYNLSPRLLDHKLTLEGILKITMSSLYR